MSETRVIKKYPNRRLYDTTDSKYITLADVRRLVLERVEFVVLDQKTQEDITRGILLQVIAEQEHEGEPMMSEDFLSQVIRAYGGAMQGFVGSYLEQSLRLFMAQQQQIRDRMRSMVGMEPFSGVASLAERNLAQWTALQEQMLKNMLRPGRQPPSGSKDED